MSVLSTATALPSGDSDTLPYTSGLPTLPVSRPEGPGYEDDGECAGNEPGRNFSGFSWLSRKRASRFCATLGNPVQLARQIIRTLPPFLRILCQAFLNYSLQRGRCHRLHSRHGLWLRSQDSCNQTGPALAAERRLAGCHLVDNFAQAQKSRSCICLFPFELLRCHVLEGANQPFLHWSTSLARESFLSGPMPGGQVRSVLPGQSPSVWHPTSSA